MGNQFIIMLVVGSLLGLFGGNAINKLNPFKAGKVAVVKNESHREEYFRDKVKGIEYRVNEKNKDQAPAKQTIGQSIGSFIDKSIKLIILGFVVSLFFGVNIFGYVLRLRKTVRQLVVGTANAKKELNGEGKILTTNLAKVMDSDAKKMVNEIKNEKSIE